MHDTVVIEIYIDNSMESNYIMFGSKSQRGGSTAGSGTGAGGSGGGGKSGSLPLAIDTLKNGWCCSDGEI